MRLDTKGRLIHGGYHRSSGSLTPAEIVQAELEAQKLPRKEIAARLGLSIHTVATRSRIIREKLSGAK